MQGKVTKNMFKEMIRREKWYTAVVSALGVLCGSYLVTTILFPRYFYMYLLIAVVLGTIMVFLVRQHRGKVTEPDMSDVTEEELERLFDRYTRRCVNRLFLSVLMAFGLILYIITLGVNSKSSELVEYINGHLFEIEVFAFLLIKNLLLVRWLNKHHEYGNEQKFRKEFRVVLISSLVYWGIASALYYGFEKVFVLNISSFVRGIFIIGIIIYNFSRINRFTYSQRRYNRIVVATILTVALVMGGYYYLSRDIWLTQPYINSVPHLYEGESKITYDDNTGVYTITKPEGDFRILQLTDIHLGGGVLSFSKDEKALKAVYALLKETKPDLVVVTGDLSYPVGLSSFSFNNTAPVQQFAAFMRNTGIPWAFTYGNHDTENLASATEHTLNEVYESLSWKTSHTLMYPYTKPQITGRNNQVIEIREQDGSLNYALFLIDSNAYTGAGFSKYDYIHDDQVEWYRDEVLRLNAEAGYVVPSLVFFHIPLQQYKTAYELYEKGSDEVTWFFGENNEPAKRRVCCSEYPSKMFDTAKELGSTKGFFCGHDHYNNMSLEYQGIRLTYGMSIDYLASPGIARDTAQRGATLIVIGRGGKMEISQIPLTSVETRNDVGQ